MDDPTLAACRKSTLGRHVGRDTSNAARREWEAEQTADPERSYLAGLAEHRERHPAEHIGDIPEPSDSRYGQDPRLVETDVDFARRPFPEMPGAA